MEYEGPATGLVYDDDPASVSQLLADKTSYQPVKPLGPADKATISVCAGHRFNPLYDLGPYWFRDSALAFSHARTSSAGDERLVVVECLHIKSGPTARTIQFTAAACIPATWIPGSRAQKQFLNTFDLQVRETDRVRIFYGKADISDTSRFVIDYSINGNRRAIEGAC